MADKATPNGGDESPPSNVAGLHDLIREVADELSELESQEQSLIEAHKAKVKPIRAKIRKIRSRVKAAEFDLEDFDYWRRIYGQESEHRVNTIDRIQILTGALGLGESLNFIDVLDSETAMRRYFDAGKTVAKAGGGRDDHDCDPDSEEAMQWQAGWDAGKAEMSKAA